MRASANRLSLSSEFDILGVHLVEEFVTAAEEQVGELDSTQLVVFHWRLACFAIFGSSIACVILLLLQELLAAVTLGPNSGGAKWAGGGKNRF